MSRCRTSTPSCAWRCGPEIKELHQRLTTTTVYVTHDQIEAMTMADKIVVMNGGNVEQIGAPLELYDNPANLFVAGFIGSPAMNFLQGHVAGGAFRSAEGTSLPLPDTRGVSDGAPIVYGIRPEHFQLAGDGGAGHGERDRADRVGDPGDGTFRRRPDHRGLPGAGVRRPGETIRITADPAMVHLFDAKTGHRMGA